MQKPILITLFLLLSYFAKSQSISLIGSFHRGMIHCDRDQSYFKHAPLAAYSYGLYYQAPLYDLTKWEYGIGLLRMGYLFTYRTIDPVFNVNAGYDHYNDLIAVPMDIKYSINPHRRLSFGVSAGLKPMFRFSSADKIAGTTVGGTEILNYKSTTMPNPLTLNADLGLFLRYNPGGRIFFTAQYAYSAGLFKFYESSNYYQNLNNNTERIAFYSSRGSTRYFQLSLSYKLRSAKFAGIE